MKLMTERYLITGGAGFIGSHLCELLLDQGHSVVAIDDLSTGRVENIQHLIRQPGSEAPPFNSYVRLS
jgi:nucleoside-diphosphate-sugar epimerase